MLYALTPVMMILISVINVQNVQHSDIRQLSVHQDAACVVLPHWYLPIMENFDRLIEG